MLEYTSVPFVLVSIRLLFHLLDIYTYVCNQDNGKNIKGFTLCNGCVDNYKFLALGCD